MSNSPDLSILNYFGMIYNITDITAIQIGKQNQKDFYRGRLSVPKTHDLYVQCTLHSAQHTFI